MAVDQFFAANSAGDFDALRALLTPDATFNTRSPANPRAFTIAGDEQLFAWNAAQGTTITSPDCSAGDPAEGLVPMRCTYFNHDALVQAVDGPPVPINMTLTVSADGITSESGSFGDPNFNRVGQPFDIWMFTHHPDERDRVGFGKWTSIDEAQENGLLVAQYAAEWADYLKTNDCLYDDGC